MRKTAEAAILRMIVSRELVQSLGTGGAGKKSAESRTDASSSSNSGWASTVWYGSPKPGWEQLELKGPQPVVHRFMELWKYEPMKRRFSPP